jgi:hypothetical protein
MTAPPTPQAPAAVTEARTLPEDKATQDDDHADCLQGSLSLCRGAVLSRHSVRFTSSGRVRRWTWANGRFLISLSPPRWED